MKKIAVGDLGEFWYGDYKEPFEQLEGGIPGHPVGVILKDDEGRLLCAFCGKVTEQLGNHARIRHGLPAADYKREVGLLQKSALVSERMRSQMSANAIRKLGDLQERGRALRGKPHGESRRGVRLAIEGQNKTGRCYAQLLAVGRSIVKEHGRLTEKRLHKRGIFHYNWEMFWGSLPAFQRAVGSPTAPRRGWTRSELIESLRNVALQIGRTPSRSDLRRYGLPSEQPYRRVFGSYAAACSAAGLDPNLPPALTGEREIQILAAYATTGSMQRARQIVHADVKTIQQVLARYAVPGYDPLHPLRARRAAANIVRRMVGWTGAEEVAAA